MTIVTSACGSAARNRALRGVAADDVEVGQVEHVQPVRSVGWEDGEVVGAEPVPAALDRDPVGDAGRRADGDDHERREHGEGV